MSNPLVAEVKDSTTAISGIPLLESVSETSKAIESGDWAGGVLGAVGTALDALGMAMDPFGSILAAGVGWLMEHVGPLSDALDALTGNPDEIKAHSETWANVGTELSSISADLAKMIAEDTASWTGPAADTYRTRGADTATLISTAQTAAEGASSGIGTAGEVVAAVRSLVRDIIAELVGHLISWALQVLFTLGIGLAWVVPQVVAAVAKTAAKIADLTKKLVDAIRKLSPLLKKLGDSFDDATKALKNIKDSKPPKPNEVKPDGNTTPSGAGPTPKDPPAQSNSGNTTPSGAKGDASSSGGNPPPVNTKSDPPADPPVTSRGLDGNTSPSGAKGNGGKGNSGGNDPSKNKEPDSKKCEFDPIDVVTGDVLLTEVDLRVPGALGELVVRHHVSSYSDGRWFGRSWASVADERLALVNGAIRYCSADAMVLTFPVPEPGAATEPEFGPPRLLRADGSGYLLTDPGRGLDRRFVPAPGNSAEFLLREVRTEDGESVELERDLSGAPTLLRHSGGANIAFDTENGRIRAIRAVHDDTDDTVDTVDTGDTGPTDGAEVLVARYDYDQHGHLTQRTNSSPRPARYDHDPRGRLLGWTDHNGAWYRYVYDEAGRCVRTVGDQGYLDGTLSYGENRTTTTDSLGHTKVFEFDDAGNVVAETDKLGHITRSEWGRHDLLLARTDPLGRRTEFEHDAAGILRVVRRPDGSEVLIVEHTETALEIAVTVAGRTFRRRYAAPALPDPYVDPLGAFDNFDDLPLSRGEEPGGEAPAPQLDLFGRPRIVHRSGAETALSWTIEGKLRALTGPDGAHQQWTYDGEGEIVSHTDALNRVVRTEHGPFGLVTAVTNAAGARTTLRYDTELRLLAVTNPAGQNWEYSYDAEGRLLSQSDFDGRVTHWTYDAAGQLVSSVNAAGERIDYRYDELGNLLERTSAGVGENYRYDPVGRLVRAAGPDLAIELAHDDQGRVVRQTTGGRTTEYDYDGVSATTRRTPSGVDVRWERFEERLDELVVGGTTLRFQRDPAGRPVALTSGPNALLRQEFDATGELAGQETPAGIRRYHRRPDGSIARREDPAGGASYEFDQLGRISAVHTAAGVERYRYDVLGNLVSSSAGTGAEAGPRQYHGGVLRSAGAVRYAHDVQGRLTQRVVATARGELTWTFTWDAHDHLTGVRTPDGTRWRYRYDPLDRRVAKQRLDPAGGVAEQVDFVWDGNKLIEAAHTVGGAPAGTLTWIHHPDDDRPVVQVFTAPDGTTRLSALVTDDAGTPVELVDAGTGAVRPLRTSLFGLARAGDADATPLRFPGQYHDPETGLHFNVFRYYDPANGRYISPDPLGLEPAPNPQGYVADPLRAADPLGLTGRYSERLALEAALEASRREAQAAQAAQAAAQSPNPSAVAAAQSATGTGKCGKGKNTGNRYNPMGGRPAKGNGSGGTSSSGPKVPPGKKDPDSGRTEAQGGGRSSGKHTLDGSPVSRNADWNPKNGHLTDVEDLNGTKHSSYSKELQDKLAEVDGYKPNNPGDKHPQWVKGHLQNDNLDGAGTKDNLTPLTQTANKNMSKGFEEPVKAVNDQLRLIKNEVPNDRKLDAAGIDPKQFDKVRDDLKNLKLDYQVDVSPGKEGLKFPDSNNAFERSIRDHLTLKAEYQNLTPDVQKYLDFRYGNNFLPEFPPHGQKLDTLTGKMTDLPGPGGSRSSTPDSDVVMTGV